VKSSFEKEVEHFREYLLGRREPFDTLRDDEVEMREYRENHGEFMEAIGIRYCVPLRVGVDLLGFAALGKRIRDEELRMEEFELLGTVGDQVAASIQNLKLSEQLQHAREMEALRKFSGFFVHDLKNLASKLSMMLENFPEHYNNPNFREDAIVLVAQSVEKMNLLTRRMSELREAPEIRAAPGNIPEVVRSSISEFEPPPGVTIFQEYGETPEMIFDAEQIFKVVTNLILNAIESVGDTGNIKVRTFMYKGWVVLEVQDDGPGMDENFMSDSLFQPFKTTKENGLGIGLFQCRTLIEAHGGQIIVRSRPGEGATFQVQLPVAPGKNKRSPGDPGKIPKEGVPWRAE
jgi:putative PEP-CTERM system histidine kinase